MSTLSNTIETQKLHKTIREFTDEKVPESILNELLEVVNRTATSNGMQQFSIIRITDKETREKIAKVSGQEYIARTPELFIFIADLYRNAHIARQMGSKSGNENDMDRFFQGFTDASLAAQNLTNAVESIGMGAVYFGSILNDPDRMVEILKLPKLTFPVVGVGFGYPNQKPQIKPRLDIKYKVFENEYKPYEDYLELIKDYDEEMQTYYDLRDTSRRVDSFSKQVLTKNENSILKRSLIVNTIKRQGFNLKLESES